MGGGVVPLDDSVLLIFNGNNGRGKSSSCWMNFKSEADELGNVQGGKSIYTLQRRYNRGLGTFRCLHPALG